MVASGLSRASPRSGGLQRQRGAKLRSDFHALQLVGTNGRMSSKGVRTRRSGLSGRAARQQGSRASGMEQPAPSGPLAPGGARKEDDLASLSEWADCQLFPAVVAAVKLHRNLVSPVTFEMHAFMAWVRHLPAVRSWTDDQYTAVLNHVWGRVLLSMMTPQWRGRAD